eukprot:m.48698 g.48698  ORF g.48698 m.48698 type:complete len:376 (-) comp20825_c0_seq1:237-1364(-)
MLDKSKWPLIILAILCGSLFLPFAWDELQSQRMSADPNTQTARRVQLQQVFLSRKTTRQNVSGLPLLTQNRNFSECNADNVHQFCQSSPRHVQCITDCYCHENTADVMTRTLCDSNIMLRMVTSASLKRQGLVIQIGAHVGFEPNDFLNKPLSQMITFASHALSSATKFQDSATPVSKWLMVEASPPNFERLQSNLEKNAFDGNQFVPINAAAVVDGPSATGTSIVFYGFSKDIDPVTGFDKRSGKKFPWWITQTTSLDYKTSIQHGHIWEKMGLNILDYVENTTVPAVTVPSLIKEQLATPSDLQVLLVDTEGFDCKILMSIDYNIVRPPMIVFEQQHCDKIEVGSLAAITKKLETVGYTLTRMKFDIVATYVA